MDKRDHFLIQMYQQMFNDIDRHHKIVWQVIGVLVGSFAVIALAERGFISIDIAVSVIVLISLWVIAHVYDSNYWYNRNLVIISNIERQFLKNKDLEEIQYYFGKHRSKNAIQTSLKIQLYFCWGLIIFILVYHFVTQVLPGFYLNWSISEIVLTRTLPYLSLLLFYIVLVKWIKTKRQEDYSEFLDNSPGKKMNLSDVNIEFGQGHPTDD